VKVGDVVVPCYTPQCCETDCVFCQSPKTNLCPKIRSTQGQGVMPDGTVRFKDSEGKDIFHFMGYVQRLNNSSVLGTYFFLPDCIWGYENNLFLFFFPEIQPWIFNCHYHYRRFWQSYIPADVAL